jgi:hypothetical protein
MNRGFVASCLVMIGAAGMGYWAWSDADSDPHRASEAIVSTPNDPASPPETEYVAAIPSGDSYEFIDLSQLFLPTGDELELQDLLNSFEAPEFLPPPRIAAVASNDSDDALDALATVRDGQLIFDPFANGNVKALLPVPGVNWELLLNHAAAAMARTCTELATHMLPLAGTEIPPQK